MSFNGKDSTTGTLRHPQEPGVLSQTGNQAKRRKVKAGWPFPGAHQVLPGQFPERSRPFPAPFSLFQILEGNRGKEQEETHRAPLPPASPQKQRASLAGTAPLPQECTPAALLPTYGPGWERTRAGGQRNLRGETRNYHWGRVKPSPCTALPQQRRSLLSWWSNTWSGVEAPLLPLCQQQPRPPGMHSTHHPPEG